MKKFSAAMWAYALIAALFSCLSIQTNAAQPARAWLIELDGKILDAQHAQQRLPPASLTKLMTALLWLQKPARQNEIITISPRAASATGAQAGLKAGERYTGSELLAVMLVSSANDACLALAEHMAGSERAFVAKMNLAARALKLKETHFANACGLDAPGHLSSVRDLRLLAEMALTDNTFRTLVAKPEWLLRRADGSSVKALTSSNHLIGRLDGIRGVKTGFTAKAGPCLIALAERNGHRVLLVLLNSKDRWWTAHRMIDEAFAHVQR